MLGGDLLAEVESYSRGARMSVRTSIIIGFTPFHLIAIRELVSMIGGAIYISHPRADRLGDIRAQANVRFLGHCEIRHRVRWAKTFFARRDMEALMRRAESVDVYLPHAFNPLANHAFFHHGVCHRHIYQDGILNYYDAMIPLRSTAAWVRQYAKGLAVGVRFRAYTGHITGIDAAPITGGFFTHPDRIVRRARFETLRHIDLGRVNMDGVAKPVRRGVLFLDQPTDRLFGRPRARELRKRTIDYTNALGGPIFYKPHYTQSRASISRGNSAWIALDHALCALPAETVVTLLDVAHVVSFCSSALVNIGLSHSDIRCHATAATAIRVTADGRPTDLGEVLGGLGVNVVSLLEA